MVCDNHHKKIVFFGTPDFAVCSLDKLCKNYEVAAVVTAVDKPQGRHNKIVFSAIKQYAIEHNLPLLQPEKLRDENFLRQLDTYNADLFVIVAFRMLPECVWRKPKYGTINVHGSLLPKYRGAAPINWAMVKGEKETGVTTFFIDDKIDTGEMILQGRTPIYAGDNFETLYNRLKFVGADILMKSTEMIFSGTLKTKQQPNEGACLAPKIEPEDCLINFENTTENISNFIRGMYPNAWFTFNDKRCKVLEAYPIDLKIVSPGEYHSDKKKYLYIGTNDGVLSIETLQIEGKNAMDIKSFLAGNAKFL